MAEPYANIVFDAFFRPSDSLEDNLSKKESKAMPGLVRAHSQGFIDRNARVDGVLTLTLFAEMESYPFSAASFSCITDGMNRR
jgi:hypothetical protein